jgi:type IV pilus assembly protein PilC
MKFSAFYLFKKDKPIKRQDIINLLTQLYTLFIAGISLTKCLHVLHQTSSRSLQTSLLSPILKGLESGQELHTCLKQFPRFFDMLSCRLIQLGEKTGKLDMMLMRIIKHQEKSIKLSKQIMRAIFYPMVVLITASSTLLFMLIFIVPRFAVLFSQFPQKLPLATRCLIQVSQIMPQIIVCSIIIMLYTAYWIFYLKKHHSCVAFFKAKLYSLPLIGKIQLKILLLRFTHYLSIALNAGIPLTEALTMTSFLFAHTKVPNTVTQIHSAISAGNRLHITLNSMTIFPPLLIQLVKTGEESGTLEQMLGKFSEMCEAEVEQSIALLHQLLEPLIICILGVIIGAITLAMYLPIFRLGSVL